MFLKSLRPSKSDSYTIEGGPGPLSLTWNANLSWQIRRRRLLMSIVEQTIGCTNSHHNEGSRDLSSIQKSLKWMNTYIDCWNERNGILKSSSVLFQIFCIHNNTNFAVMHCIAFTRTQFLQYIWIICCKYSLLYLFGVLCICQ